MAKNKFYAIKHGEDPKTKETVKNVILDIPWTNGAELYVKGIAGAEYKGFPTREKAEAYLGAATDSAAKEEKKNNTSVTHKKDVLYCYVDGSYNKDIPNYGYGLVCVVNGKVLHVDKGAGNNEQAIEMHQVGGELLGAMKSLLYAKNHSLKEVVIFHDYLGVGKHATGEWKRKTDFSKTYYEWMQKFFQNNPGVTIAFEKVDAHTGDDFNELADGYAKLSVGLKPNPVFFKMAEKYSVPTR